MSNPWFRMYTEFANDPIVQSLSFDDQRHYVVLLCLKCAGVLDRKLLKENRNRIICRGLGLDQYAAEELKQRLKEVGFISNNWQPKAWSKRQYKSDKSAERTRKYRENKNIVSVTQMSPKTSLSTSPSVSVSVSDLHSNYINVSEEIWKEFTQHRKEINKPLTVLSASKNLKILHSLCASEQQQSVDATIANRWTGLFAPKQIKKKTQGKMSRAREALKKYAS